MTELLCAAVSGLCAIAAAFAGCQASRASARSERSSALRRRESLLSLEMMDATLKLSVVTANALTGGHNNGNVALARERAGGVSEKYEQFMRETTAYEVGK